MVVCDGRGKHNFGGAAARAPCIAAGVSASIVATPNTRTALTCELRAEKMADEIEAELKAAGKELDKVRRQYTKSSARTNTPPGRGNRAYVKAHGSYHTAQAHSILITYRHPQCLQPECLRRPRPAARRARHRHQEGLPHKVAAHPS